MVDSIAEEASDPVGLVSKVNDIDREVEAVISDEVRIVEESDSVDRDSKFSAKAAKDMVSEDVAEGRGIIESNDPSKPEDVGVAGRAANSKDVVDWDTVNERELITEPAVFDRVDIEKDPRTSKPADMEAVSVCTDETKIVNDADVEPVESVG